MTQSAASIQPSSVVVFRDGLGERRRVTDSTGRESLTCALTARWWPWRRSKPRWCSVPVVFTDFRHPSFCDLRGVERLSGGTVAVVADAVPGSRIADLLAAAVEHHLTLDINAALCLIRQLVPAIRALHEHDRDIIHGAIGIERIVVRLARLVVVDHTLGSPLISFTIRISATGRICASRCRDRPASRNSTRVLDRHADRRRRAVARPRSTARRR